MAYSQTLRPPSRGDEEAADGQAGRHHHHQHPDPPSPPIPRYQYQLLYSKSRVTLHPTPYAKDNIPGYLALLRRHRIRNHSIDSNAAGPSSQPLRRQFSTQDNSYDVMLSWLPEELVNDRSETAKFVDVELREAEGLTQRGEEEEECIVTHSDSGKVLSMKEVVEDESVLVQPPPLALPSTSPTSPASYAFSHPLGMLYSLQATPPTISNWYGSLIISLVGGQTLAPLYFHDDESRTTILSMIRASKTPSYPPTILSASTPSPPAWGGDELVQQLKKYAFIHRSVHDHRIFLVNPDPEDLETHSTPLFADDAVDTSPTAARRRRNRHPLDDNGRESSFPDDPFAPSYGSAGSGSGTSTPNRLDGQRDTFTSWAKTTRMSLLSSFSHVTRSARDASRQILTSPSTAPYAARLPAAVQSFAQAGPLGPFGPSADEVSKLSQKAGVMEYDSARVYLAKWARLVAEEGERNRLREEAKGGGIVVQDGKTSKTEQGGLGGFEVLERGTSSPLRLIRNYDPISLVEFQSFFDPRDGSPKISFEEFKTAVFSRGLAPSTRKLAWPFLLDVVPWLTSASERSTLFSEKREEYHRLKLLWSSVDSLAAKELRERDDMVDQRHRIRVDCLRTDRKHAMFSSGAKSDGDGGEESQREDLTASLAGISSRQAGQGDSSNHHILALGEILLTFTLYDTLEEAGALLPTSSTEDYTNILQQRRVNETEIGGYVQGMSDLCAPLYVVTEGDEVEAFWCLVGFMKRMRPNFLSSQSGMKTQLLQLQSLIRYSDPELYAHLESTGSLNLFFCFRWLLVRFKREFSNMEDVLRVWEACWAVEPQVPCPTTTKEKGVRIQGQGQARESTGRTATSSSPSSSLPPPPPSASTTTTTSSSPPLPNSNLNQRVSPIQCAASTTPTASTTPHLHLFLCLHLLLSNRSPTIDYLDCFDEILQFFQGLSGHVDVEDLIRGAETIWIRLRARVQGEEFKLLEKKTQEQEGEEGEVQNSPLLRRDMGRTDDVLDEIRTLVGL